MAHPQNSHRGLLSKSRVDVGTPGLFFLDYSANTAALSSDSTGTVSFVGGVQPSGSSTAKMTGDSTGVVFAGDLTLGTHVLSTNSTGLTVNGAEVSTA